jgi:hypothetical protein
VALVDFSPFPTGLAVPENVLVFDVQLCLGVPAFSTKNKFVDEHVEEVLQFFLVVGSVDNMTLGGSVADDFCLGAEFETEKLCDVHGRTSEVMGDIHDIWDDGLDAVSFSFDLLVRNLMKRYVPWTARGASCIDRKRHRHPCGY